METNYADLISELPDELLLKIYSFLDDETIIIQSGVLSKRWSHLWTLVPFPEHIKQMRYNFKTRKIEIQKEKLEIEKLAKNTISQLSIDVVKSIGLYCVHALLITILGFQMFGIVHFCLTLVNMLHVYFSCWNCHSKLKCFDEASLKKLQERDYRLTLAATNSYPTGSKLPMLELLFSDGFQPRYAEKAKLYGLFGMSVLMITSCIIAVFRWKFEFLLGGDGLKGIFLGYLGFSSFLIHLGYMSYLWSSTLLCYVLNNRLLSSFY